MFHSRLFQVGLVVLTGVVGVLYVRSITPTPIPEPVCTKWFEDVSDEVGLKFTHDCGPIDGRYYMPQSLGSGAALFDFDSDGLLDILLLNAGGSKGRPNTLYRQLPSGQFQDVSRGSGLDFSGLCMGVAIGDVNNDGRPDVLVTEFGGVRLLLNRGQGKFEDVTSKVGLRNPLWAVSAAFLDYDRDGWLDLVVVNYVDYDPSWPCSRRTGAMDFCGPESFSGSPTRLFRNVGRDGVQFQDVSFESGIGRKPGPGFVPLCADFDGDGWPDIFVTNDAKPNHMWMNQHDGTFRDEAVTRGAAVNCMGRTEANMGIGWGDVDGDGLQDLLVTHLHIEHNTLWKQGPRGLFEDKTADANLHRSAWRGTGFGTILADFDNDGWPDAVVTNGKVFRDEPPPPCSGLHPFWCDYAQRSQLFRNKGRGVFEDLSPQNEGPGGIARDARVGRGVVVGDLRNDGRLWVLIVGVGGAAHLYKNVAPNPGNWLGVTALDPSRRRVALGAEVTLHAGGRQHVRTIQSAGSFASSSDSRAHFGLGSATHVDQIHVTWPDGSKEKFPGGLANRHVVVERGMGTPVK